MSTNSRSTRQSAKNATPGTSGTTTKGGPLKGRKKSFLNLPASGKDSNPKDAALDETKEPQHPLMQTNFLNWLEKKLDQKIGSALGASTASKQQESNNRRRHQQINFEEDSAETPLVDEHPPPTGAKQGKKKTPVDISRKRKKDPPTEQFFDFVLSSEDEDQLPPPPNKRQHRQQRTVQQHQRNSDNSVLTSSQQLSGDRGSDSSDSDELSMRSDTFQHRNGTSSRLIGRLWGDDVAPRLRQKISRQEFIDFSELDTYSDNSDNSYHMEFDAYNKPIFVKTKAKKALSFNSWSRAFVKFMAVHVSIHASPHNAVSLALEMLSYHETVRDVMVQGGQWEQFDVHFRKLMAASPFAWSKQSVKWDLLWRFCSPHTPLHQHATAAPPPESKKSGNSSKSDQVYVPPPFCRSFHANGGCSASPCPYVHNCFKCYSGEHSGVTCNKKYLNLGSKSRRRYKGVVTPISANRLKDLLTVTNYDTNLTNTLVQGFTQGFDLGHNDSIDSINAVPNAKQEELEIMREKIDKELTAGRVEGPFDCPPFKTYHLSPLFLVPKSAPGQYRMILNLSFPKNHSSINSNISQSSKSVEYASIRDAIKHMPTLGKGAFSCKIDIQDAFRLIPVHPSQHHKLCFKIGDEYFFDKVLPQGCSSSCKLFELFATALHHIFNHFSTHCGAVHYLDDFLFIAQDFETCLHNRDLFISICHHLGVPLNPKKVTVPSTSTTFLGILLDTNLGQARLPENKVKQYVSDIEAILKNKFISVKQAQSLLGKLNFSTAVVPTRAFLHSVIDLIPKKGNPRSIFIKKGTRADIELWCTFLKQYNGVSFFRSLNIVTSDAINLQADASKIGMGATYGKRWLVAKYDTAWQQLNIAILEFFPLYVLISVYGHLMKNSIIIFYTDNMAVCEIVKKCLSKEKIIVYFLRKLVLQLLIHNIDLRAEHVPGKSNTLCDKLSRFQITEDLLREHNMNAIPDDLPSDLTPNNCWLKQIQTLTQV